MNVLFVVVLNHFQYLLNILLGECSIFVIIKNECVGNWKQINFTSFKNWGYGKEFFTHGWKKFVSNYLTVDIDWS